MTPSTTAARRHMPSISSTCRRSTPTCPAPMNCCGRWQRYRAPPHPTAPSKLTHHSTTQGRSLMTMPSTLTNRRATLLAGGAAVLFVTLAGAAPAQAPATYKFGLAMPLSGSQALYGTDQVKAAEAAVAPLNATGGINGKKLEMIPLDTQADPQVGINAVNRLVSVEKVPVFITAWSSVVRAVAPIANDNKVVELSI